MISELYIRSVNLKKDKRGMEDYLSELPIIKYFTTLEFQKPVSFLVGENGSGKSTLLEAIAVSYGFNAEGGTKNFNFSSKDTHSNLYEYLTVVKGYKQPKDGFFLRAESFYNVASEIDRLDGDGGPSLYDSYGGKSLHQQSHGESFLSLVINRFRGSGIYLLDEPEAALSPARQLTLISRIDQLVKTGAQFIIATHSPILMAFPDAEIFITDAQEKLRAVPYKETDHYKITKDFLDQPERMLRYLLDD